MFKISEITVNGSITPIGIDESPVFCWKLQSDKNDTFQKSFSLTVFDGKEEWRLEKQSNESINVYYDGELVPCALYTVKLTVTDNYGRTAELVSYFETGLLGNFTGEWITDGRLGNEAGCPIFKRSFSLKKKVKKARLYSSALGVYFAELNGKRIGNIHMAPGWTNYNKRIEYQTYDVTDVLKEENELYFTVGKGWYRGVVGYFHAVNFYGDKAGLIAELHIEYTDGTKDVIKTDNNWTWNTGAVRDSEIYDGEYVDFTFVPKEDKQVSILNHSKNILVSQECPSAKMLEEVSAKQLIVTPEGDKVIDFGQNLTGFVKAKIKGKRGQKVTIRHAEVLDENGNFYTVNLRAAKATDTIICSGGTDDFAPEFTFHGFRYIAVDGLENINLGDFTAVVCYSDLKKTGNFSCSHKGLNQLQHNIQWGQKGNFFDIPTDCPQRDERLGWTGDAQVFFNTAAFNMDVKDFFKKWMRDVASEQSKELGCPTSIPDVIHEKGTAGWGDCCTIIPWNLYKAYGDKRVLEEQFPVMVRWLDYIESNVNENNLWQSGFQHADWLALDGGDNADDRIGATDVYFVANAFYANSVDIAYKTAKILGYSEDAERLKKRYDAVIAAFRDEYVTNTGRLVSDTQTAAVLALNFNLVEERHRKRILERLVENIHRHNDHFVTGFLGTPYICHVLSENGYHELAGKIVQQEDFPSWLYAVNMGATTIWERWDSMNPDRTISDTGMTSFNHYAYGCVGEWLYSRLCGIKNESEAYKTSIIAPSPVEGITWAQASVETPYGKLSSKWEKCGKAIKVEVEIPVNTSAVLISPIDGSKTKLGSGKYTFNYGD